MRLTAEEFCEIFEEAIKNNGENPIFSLKEEPGKVFKIIFNKQSVSSIIFDNEVVMYNPVSQYGPSLSIAKYRDYPDNKDESPLFKTIEYLNNFYENEMKKMFPEEERIWSPIHYKYSKNSKKAGENYPCPFAKIKIYYDTTKVKDLSNNTYLKGKLTDQTIGNYINKGDKMTGIISVGGVRIHDFGISLSLVLKEILI